MRCTTCSGMSDGDGRSPFARERLALSRHSSRTRSIAVPLSRFSYGTDETPVGLSITTTCESSNTIGVRSAGSGAGLASSSLTAWPAFSRCAASVSRAPSTHTLPVSTSMRARDHARSAMRLRRIDASV